MQRLFGRLHAGLHADHIADVPRPRALFRSTRKSMVRTRLARNAPPDTARTAASPVPLRDTARARAAPPASYAERETAAHRLQKKVERIEHRHLGDQIHLDAQLARRFREHQAGQIVRLRILLPVDEMFARGAP